MTRIADDFDAIRPTRRVNQQTREVDHDKSADAESAGQDLPIVRRYPSLHRRPPLLALSSLRDLVIAIVSAAIPAAPWHHPHARVSLGRPRPARRPCVILAGMGQDTRAENVAQRAALSLYPGPHPRRMLPSSI